MALDNRVASPSELAGELGETVKHVSYHVKQLEELGCVELVSIEPAENGRVMKHFYRAIQRAYFEADGWERLDDGEKHAVVTTFMRQISDDLSKAMVGGTFYDPDDNHISRTPMVVDEEGWQEVISLLDGTAEELLVIQARVSARKNREKAKKMLAKVAMIHFRSPGHEKKAWTPQHASPAIRLPASRLDTTFSLREPSAATPTQLAMALSRTVRTRMMTVLNERSVTSNELAGELGESVKQVTYHMKKLVELGCIESVAIQPPRAGGKTERSYRATVRPSFNAAEWEQLGEKEKHSVLTTIMGLISEDIADAQATGTFDDPDDNHISRTPMVVDGEGWQEVISLLDKAADELLVIQAKVNARTGGERTGAMFAKVEIIHFRSPDNAKMDGAARGSK